jgi:predicted acyltransferase
MLIACGLLALAAGWLLNETGLCPVVKRIWTPSWAIFSTGWTLLLLAGFYCIIDLWGLRAWAFLGIVVGMNSIAIYMMKYLIDDWIVATARTHFGQELFSLFGSIDEKWIPVMQSGFALLVMWLICYWMYRRRIFLRI